MGAARAVADLAELVEREGYRERPVAVLDLDAFDANAADLARRAASWPTRTPWTPSRSWSTRPRSCT